MQSKCKCEQWAAFTACPCPDEREKAAVRALEAACNASDGTQFEIFLSNQFNLHPEQDAFFFAWECGELVGVLSLYADEEEETEITALVMPERRRQGVFTALLGRALEALAGNKPGRLTFKTDDAFPAGGEIARRWCARACSCEYLMTAGRGTPCGEGAGVPGLTVGPAQEKDLDALAAIEQEAFGGSPQEARRYVIGTFEGDNQLLLAAWLNGEAVGLASVDFAGRWAYLYGVCVAKARRGMGVGTGLLRGALEVLLGITEKRPALSVEADNEAALHLYTNAGFAVVGRQVYYTLPYDVLAGRLTAGQ